MPVTITLTDDEALVLFELLASETMPVETDSAEWHTLNSVVCDLEKQVVAAFLPTYSEELEKAKKNILGMFAGGAVPA